MLWKAPTRNIPLTTPLRLMPLSPPLKPESYLMLDSMAYDSPIKAGAFALSLTG